MLALPSPRISVALVGLYLAQAVPLYLVAAALPPILRSEGIGLNTIGSLGVLLAPWVLKALWAPWVDRLSRGRLGRKGVVAICFVITIGGILALSTLHPVEDAGVFFPILMMMALSSATQDIASDGWAIEHLPAEQQPGGNALQGAAVAFGVLIGGAGTLFLYDFIGWTTTLWAIAGVTFALMVPFFMQPEAAERCPLPADTGKPALWRFLKFKGAWAMIGFALIFRLPEGLVKALEQPFLVDQGFTLSQIGAISGGSAALVGLGGAFAGALMIRRFGLVGFLIFLICGRTVVFAAFYIAATVGMAPEFIVVLSVCDTFLRYIEITGLYTAFMRFSSLKQAGTDFTLLTSATLLMYMIGSMVAGQLAHVLGYGPVFLTATILSGLTGWIALLLLPAQVRTLPDLSLTRTIS